METDCLKNERPRCPLVQWQHQKITVQSELRLTRQSGHRYPFFFQLLQGNPEAFADQMVYIPMFLTMASCDYSNFGELER